MIKWVCMGRDKYKLFNFKQKLIVFASMLAVGVILVQIMILFDLKCCSVFHSAIIGAFIGLSIGLTGRIAIEKMGKTAGIDPEQETIFQ